MLIKLIAKRFTTAEAQNFMRLLVFVRPYKMRLVYALLAIVGVAATESYLAAFIAPLVNLGFAPVQAQQALGDQSWYQAFLNIRHGLTHMVWGTPAKVWMVPLFFIFLVLVRGVCRYVSSYLMSWVGAMVVHELRALMFAKLLVLPSEVLLKTPSAFISNRFLVEAEAAVNNASNVFVTLVRDSLIVVGLVVVLLVLNWQLTLIVLLMFPALAWLSRYYRVKLKSVQIRSQLGVAQMGAVINETHLGHRVVKLFGGYDLANTRFVQINGALMGANKKLAQAAAARSPFSELIASLALAVVIFIALWQSQQGVTTIGAFMAFIVAMLQMVSPIKNLSNVGIPMQRMFLAADSICAFLDQASEPEGGRAHLGAQVGAIEFDNVSVVYGDSSEAGQGRVALDGVSLSIEQGEKVALIGRSGGGKTTLVNLLPRFVVPTAGVVRLGGVNLSEVPLEELRAMFAVVSQDVFLFDDSLYQNVIYGKPEATPEQVEQALRAANLWEVVAAHPEGWLMQVGANGNQLSGGQRQRLSIARAILKDAPILILDEATSALDNESELLVQQALDRLMQGRTSIIIAHRLTTIEQVDRIVVLDHGQVVEQGSHAQLLAQNQFYARLRMQPEVH